MNILIVEDHPLFAQSLSQHWLSNNHTVSWAKSYSEFLERMAHNRFHVVFVDIVLKDDAHGLDICEKLVNEHPNVKVIIISSFDNDTLVSEAERLRVHGYLLKSADLEEIDEAMELVMKGRVYYSKELEDKLKRRKKFYEKNNVSLPIIKKRKLTPRELEVIKCIVDKEHSDDAIAGELSLSAHTIRDYKKSIYQKLDVHDVAGIVKFYFRYLYEGKSHA